VRRGTGSLTGSPALVGAVTVLITTIAVFISYNANQGLPFVPTYDLNAELPSGAKLVKGNEVRVGGFRVGVVDDLRPKTLLVQGKPKAVALVRLKLDKTIQPLARDSRIEVRPRSALGGLKYIQITPGHGHATYTAGDTVPVRFASEPLEAEDLFSTFDRRTRPAIRQTTEGLGDALAGRGASVNIAIQALDPLLRYLEPVARNLGSPRTRLDNFFRQLGRAAGEAAPVAHTGAVLFANMADTFQAISDCESCLKQTVQKGPPALDAGIRSLPVQRRFYRDFELTSHDLRPAARALVRYLPAINSALETGIPVQRRQPELNDRTTHLSKSIDHLFSNPSTLLSLKDARTGLRSAHPLIEYLAPYQLVCDYWNYWWTTIGEVHQQPSIDRQGTVENIGGKFVDPNQPNSYNSTVSSRPVDVPKDENPLTATDPSNGQPLHRYQITPYAPAIDAQGNADCQRGQEGYVKGPLNHSYGRFGARNGVPTKADLPESSLHDQLFPNPGSGGNWSVTMGNFPGLMGGTWVSRQLGIENLRDVP
jgi:ABC-type transporter Mla subunit MlaD